MSLFQSNLRSGGGGCESSRTLAPSLFLFRCFLFGRAISVFSERFFNRLRPKKKRRRRTPFLARAPCERWLGRSDWIYRNLSLFRVIDYLRAPPRNRLRQPPPQRPRQQQLSLSLPANQYALLPNSRATKGINPAGAACERHPYSLPILSLYPRRLP